MIKELVFDRTPKRLATHDDITFFEKKFNFKLSGTFVDFCKRYNGGYPSSINSWYPVPSRFEDFHSEYQIGKGGVLSDGLYGLSEEIPGALIAGAMQELPSALDRKLLPISFDLSGNFVVVIEGQLNETVYWFDHELWEAPSKPLLFPIADDLEMFYNGLTENPYV